MRTQGRTSVVTVLRKSQSECEKANAKEEKEINFNYDV